MRPSEQVRSALSRVIFSALLGLCCMGQTSCAPPNASALLLDTAAAPVAATIRRLTTRLVTLKTSETTVVTTPEHPFAKRGRGWTPAIELAVGDPLEVRDGQGTTIVELEIRDVAPTPVYNLTVSRPHGSRSSHSYFVSSEDLLVHNVDCVDAPADRASHHQRPGTSNPSGNPRDPRVEGGRPSPNSPRRPDLSLNDTDGDKNCTLCSLAALTGADRLSVFLREHGDEGLWLAHENGMANDAQVLKELKRFGLVGADTAAPREFPKSSSIPSAKAEARRHRVQNFALWSEVTKFMERPNASLLPAFMKTPKADANTFLVSFDYWAGGVLEAHTVLAVRDNDGSIIYIDFQQNPPTRYDTSKERIFHVTVMPTNVNWHDNDVIGRTVGNLRNRGWWNETE